MRLDRPPNSPSCTVSVLTNRGKLVAVLLGHTLDALICHGPRPKAEVIVISVINVLRPVRLIAR